MRFKGLLAGVAALFALGCEEGFAPQSEIHGLRVLAVRPTPASGGPGVTVGLDMLLADRRAFTVDEDGTRVPPPVDVKWLAGCHNPPSRQYFACAPVLGELARHPVEAAGAGLIGSGLHYDLVLPDDILSAAPRLPQDPVHFGVSYVFFAACVGTLEAASGPTEHGFPFECRDAAGGVVGPAGQVIGFATVYSYEGAESQNESPVLTGLSFDGAPAPASGIDAFAAEGMNAAVEPCSSADECEGDAAARPRACSEHGVCVPAVKACAGDGCPAFRVEPEVELSGEAFTGGNEIVWASYYTTLGSFGSETRLVVDRVNGPARDISSGWKPPGPSGDTQRTSRLWVTVNDQRGGATWAFFDVVVE